MAVPNFFKGTLILGIILLVVGIILLAIQGFNPPPIILTIVGLLLIGFSTYVINNYKKADEARDRLLNYQSRGRVRVSSVLEPTAIY